MGQKFSNFSWRLVCSAEKPFQLFIFTFNFESLVRLTQWSLIRLSSTLPLGPMNRYEYLNKGEVIKAGYDHFDRAGFGTNIPLIKKPFGDKRQRAQQKSKHNPELLRSSRIGIFGRIIALRQFTRSFFLVFILPLVVSGLGQ